MINKAETPLTIRGQIFDGAVRGQDPAVRVVAVARRIVHIHLDQILVEAVVATVPSPRGVQENPVRDVHRGADETGEGLVGCWRGVQKVRLRLLRQISI